MPSDAMIKVGYCVAYDWPLITKSLPRVYPHADRICLSLDRNRRSWSGQPYAIDEAALRAYVREVDTAGKIDLYEDEFWRPGNTPMDSDTRQRRLMADRLGAGGWHVQVDVDEYFLDFGAFAAFLRELEPAPTPAGEVKAVNCPVVPLFKDLGHGYLYVKFPADRPETLPFATTRPDYHTSREVRAPRILAPHYVVHETWARDEAQLRQKLESWSHSHELQVDRDSYMRLWLAVDAQTHRYLANFHPLEPVLWPALGYCEGRGIDELMANLAASRQLTPPAPRASRLGRAWRRLRGR